MAETRYIFNLYKEEGETPLERLNRFRDEHPVYSDLPMTYAGRLDPLASGVLLVIAGDIDEEEKKKLLALPKRYVVEVLFGVSTDTGDVLGLIQDVKNNSVISKVEIENALVEASHMTHMKYPAYSSKTFEGKPLWKYAREDVDVPHQEREIKIHEIILRSVSEISFFDLKNLVMQKISKVHGDFRQNEIIEKWEECSVSSDAIFNFATIEVEASSGTYMRVLAEEIGKKLNVPALALSIHRVKVGEYTVDNKNT